MFSLSVDNVYDDDKTLLMTQFVFTVSGMKYAIFDPHYNFGRASEWRSLIYAIKNSKTQIVEFRDGDGNEYCVTVRDGDVIFSTDYGCTAPDVAIDAFIPAIACVDAFEQILNDNFSCPT